MPGAFKFTKCYCPNTCCQYYPINLPVWMIKPPVPSKRTLPFMDPQCNTMSHTIHGNCYCMVKRQRTVPMVSIMAIIAITKMKILLHCHHHDTIMYPKRNDCKNLVWNYYCNNKSRSSDPPSMKAWMI